MASLAEGAAESIGARGLLVRVGAYFHDIGKMLKPGYFTENQQQGVNRHDTLLPAMSTLIIVAHVKDGVELALNHHLPQPIIDFIEQHHGTTLVEYFYHQASERSQADPEGGQVEESAFRYPGPKPQTREAAVLMLADAVESTCRSLSEPTPARIESVVETLAMKRLLDGQFDESGLTLPGIQPATAPAQSVAIRHPWRETSRPSGPRFRTQLRGLPAWNASALLKRRRPRTATSAQPHRLIAQPTASRGWLLS